MPVISVIRDMDTSDSNPLKGKSEEELVYIQDPHIIIGTLAGGMQSGATSIMITMKLPNGKTLAAETSLAAIKSAFLVLNQIPK